MASVERKPITVSRGRAKPPEAESLLASRGPMKSAKLIKFTMNLINFAAFIGR